MADIKPIGIDQTTGQQRPLQDADTAVDNIGNQIQMQVTDSFDFSSVVNKVNIIFPWSNGDKIDSPATLSDAVRGRDVKFSPNGEFLAVATNPTTTVGPLSIYQRAGSGYTFLNDPASQAPTQYRGLAWSPDGQFLVATSTDTGDELSIYQRSGSTFTHLSDPATLPNSDSWAAAFSPNGEYLAVTLDNSPYLYVYLRDGTTFTKLDDPSSLPTGTAREVSWSADGKFLAVGVNASVSGSVGSGLFLYQISGQGSSTTFTLSNPATTPNAAISKNDLGWSPRGRYLAVSNAGSETLIIYQRSGDTLTALDLPASQPTQPGVSWHPSGNILATFLSSSPYLRFYKVSDSSTTLLSEPASAPPTTLISSAFSSDGQFLAVGTQSGSEVISLYQTADTLPQEGILVFRNQ